MVGKIVTPAVANGRETIAQPRRGVYRRLCAPGFARLPANPKPFAIFCKTGRNFPWPVSSANWRRSWPDKLIASPDHGGGEIGIPSFQVYHGGPTSICSD